MTVEITLRSVVSALERIHVLGADAELLCGSIKAVKNVIAAIDKAKEEQQNDDHNGQREDV